MAFAEHSAWLCLYNLPASGLENVLDLEALSAAAIAVQSQHFTDHAPAWLAFHMDDKIDGLADLGFHIFKRRLGVAVQYEVRKAP